MLGAILGVLDRDGWILGRPEGGEDGPTLGTLLGTSDGDIDG